MFFHYFLRVLQGFIQASLMSDRRLKKFNLPIEFLKSIDVELVFKIN